jgi:hypothetical protein
MSCGLVNAAKSFLSLHDPEDEGTWILQNVRNYSTFEMAHCYGILAHIAPPLLKPQTSKQTQTQLA